MPMETNNDNPIDGIQSSAAQFDETDHNVVDDDSSDDASGSIDTEALSTGKDTILDPASILEAAEDGSLIKSTSKSNETKSKQSEVDRKGTNNKDAEKSKKDESEGKDKTNGEDNKDDETSEDNKEESENDKEEEVFNKENLEVKENKNKRDFPKERDYSEFTQEEVKYLKKCDNPVFHVLSNKIKEHKANYQKAELERQNLNKIVNEKAIPIEWFQNPDAYQLTPEYKELSNNYSTISREQAHFKAQFLKIRKGEQWVDLIGWKKDGSPVYSEAKEPSEEAALDLQERINQAGVIQGQIQGQVANMAGSFKERHEADTKAIVNAVEHHISKMHEGFKPEQKHIDAAMELLPRSKRSDPLAISVCKMYGVIAKLASELQNKSKAKTEETLKNNDDKEAGVKTSNLSKNGNRINGNNNSSKTILFKGKRIPAEYDPSSFKRSEDE